VKSDAWLAIALFFSPRCISFLIFLLSFQLGFYSSAIGLAAMLFYQALVTWPNRQQLLLQPLKSSKSALNEVILTHAAYGAIYTIHFYLQAFVLQVSYSQKPMSAGLRFRV
jgi:hypothetical protein